MVGLLPANFTGLQENSLACVGVWVGVEWGVCGVGCGVGECVCGLGWEWCSWWLVVVVLDVGSETRCVCPQIIEINCAGLNVQQDGVSKMRQKAHDTRRQTAIEPVDELI